MTSRDDSVESIPLGWAPATVGTIADYVNGLAFKPSDWGVKGRPIIRIQNLTGQNDHLNLTTREVDPVYIVQPGTILVSWSATLDVFVWRGPEAVLNQHIFKVVPVSAMSDHSFVRWALKNAIEEMWRGEHTHGTTMRHINRGPFLAHRLDLPPAKEQVRIAEAIESCLTRLDAAVASLERVQAKLKAYRASVLKAAVEGRLVPTEASLARAEKRDYEPADVLLARILKERRRRWEEAELARLKSAGKTPKDDRWKAKYKDPVAVDTSRLPEPPEGWCWARVEQVTSVITKGASPEWQGFRYVETGGIPFVRSQNVRWGRLDLDDLAYVEARFNEKERKSILRSGDVLLNIVGASIGRAAIVPERLDGANTNQAVAILRSVTGMNSVWLATVLVSPAVQVRIHSAKVDVARANLSLADAADLLTSVPPQGEQDRIIAEVDRCISTADAEEVLASRACLRITRLRQAVLKWAFEGKLVDQDPSDEPAERLLARIRAERASADPIKKSRRHAAKGAA